MFFDWREKTSNYPTGASVKLWDQEWEDGIVNSQWLEIGKTKCRVCGSQFKDSKTLNVGKLKGLLSEKLMNSEDPTNSDDVVRIVILNAMVKFFFTTTGDLVMWFYFQYIENLEDTNLYNWGKEIVDNFITSVKEAEVEKVQGCNLLLLVSPILNNS